MGATAQPIVRAARIEKSPEDGLGVEYALRLAPFNIARVRLERLGPTRAFVHWVFVPPAFRGRGIGQVLLARVLRDADREGISLSLIAKACGTMSQNPLEEWYRQNGFVRRGRAPDGGERMVRAPQPRAQSRRLKRAA